MKISEKTMKALMDDTGLTTVKVFTEREFIIQECGGTKSDYAKMIGISPQKYNNRTKRDRRIIELNGQRLAVLVEAVF